jgi:hypothetical protein
MVGDCQNGVVPIKFWEFCDEIKGNCLKWECICYWSDQVEGWLCGICVDFVHLAVGTAFDVLGDVIVHAWPPVILSNVLHSFCNSGVSYGNMIMKKGNHPPLKVIISHNDEGIALSPEISWSVLGVVRSASLV